VSDHDRRTPPRRTGGSAVPSGPARQPAKGGRRAAGKPAQKSARTADGKTPDAAAGHPSLAFVTPAVRERLSRIGIFRLEDMVMHLPLRYEDETQTARIADAPSGETVQIEGVVTETEVHFRPRRQLVSRIDDDSGTVHIRFFNFYPSQQKALAPGAKVRAIGEIRQGFFGAEMVHPRFRVVRGEAPLPTALTPVYPTTAGLSQDTLRKLAMRALSVANLADALPEPVRRKLRLEPFMDAVRYLHNPPPDADAVALASHAHPAWRRVKFDELLAQQVSMRLHHERRNRIRAHPLLQHSRLSRRLLDSLSFRLTRAQSRALDDIRADLSRPHPMQRLLQGDVGSGKTIVAALAALQAIESGYQASVMAPTEILAEQHYRKFAHWLEPLGIRVAWLAGSSRKKEREAATGAVESGEAMLAVGTHALFQEQVTFHKLGLAIIDEQHRFGVHQRLALRMKGSRGDRSLQPHQLMMSATPIPRTLAMSYYADLDVSVIDEMPPGRTPVVTKLVSESRRDEVLQRVRDACLKGSQAYWVCPLIEESEALQLQTAIDTFERLRQEFPEIRIGLVHGRLPAGEKAAAMQAFQRNELQLLVATTVIEVGVDVPNASLMVIEHAERMGLSQLHQLRGRVGRGADASVCILLYQGPLSENARERLKIIYENTDGFEVARHDLRLRGPGEFLGARQSGVPMLRFADLEIDLDLLESARTVAPQLIRDHPDLVERQLERWFGGRQEYLRV
jgi:ATP-dependent DNA helicase RecG